ncbi:MAG: hypothetical protein C5B49_04585 [Bdellovibrio sp.]|nr:MAG: hypothetical protein C5B49_04585 [Bdellovibrio sp.]
MKVGDRIVTRIEKLVVGGAGLTRTPYGVVFVDLVLPQEEVEVEVTEVKKDYSRGKVVTIREPSPRRIEAPCPYFGECGGCDWQHITYEDQAEIKQRLLRELFVKNFSYSNLWPIVASPRPYHYRNRVQMSWGPLGTCYRKKRSHELLPVKRCLIANEAVNTHLESLAQQPNPPQAVRVQVAKAGVENGTGVFSFSQVNEGVNDRLLQAVLSWASDLELTDFLDLYCGAGNFSFPLAERFSLVSGLGVELDPHLARRAQSQVYERKWRHRLAFHCGAVDDFLCRIPTSEGSLILLDPPRSGCGERISHQLGQIRARSIIYVSCAPMTLLRDLKIILSGDRWKIRRVQGFDMFPQTAHLEVAVQLIDRTWSRANLGS